MQDYDYDSQCGPEALLAEIASGRPAAPERSSMLARLHAALTNTDQSKELAMRKRLLRVRSLYAALACAVLLCLLAVLFMPRLSRRPNGQLALSPAATALASEEGRLLVYDFDSKGIDPALLEQARTLLADCVARLNAGHAEGLPELSAQLLQGDGGLQVLVLDAQAGETDELRDCLAALPGLPQPSEGATLLFSHGQAQEQFKAVKLDSGAAEYLVVTAEELPYKLTSTEKVQYIFFPVSLSQTEIDSFLAGISKEEDGIWVIDVPQGAVFTTEDGRQIVLGEGAEFTPADPPGGSGGNTDNSSKEGGT